MSGGRVFPVAPQLWHPSIIDTVPLVQPPSHHGAQLDVVYGLAFFHSINRCFLMALRPLTPAGFSFPVPSPWLERCPPTSRQRRLQLGPGRVSLHFSSQSGVKSLLLEMSREDDVGPLMLLVGEGRLSNRLCCGSRGQSTQ